MQKTKTKKSTKLQCKCKFKCCPLTGILIILVIGLAVFSGYLLFNKNTLEEKKRLQAFETLLESDIDDMLAGTEEFFHIRSLETGITKDNNDIYIKFKYIKFEDEDETIPSYINTGVIYYPCGDVSGKVIGDLVGKRCGKHIDVDEPKYFDEATKNDYKEITAKIDAIEKEKIDLVLRNGVAYNIADLPENAKNEFWSLSDETNNLYKQLDEKLDILWDYL